LTAKYDQIAQLLTGKSTARAGEGLDWIQRLCRILKFPSLTEFGVQSREFSNLVAKAQKASSMKGNPVPLSDDELMEILKKVSRITDYDIRPKAANA
jgi:alcohol dehydrogenase class IV